MKKVKGEPVVSEKGKERRLDSPLWRDEKAARLLEAILSGEISEMKPRISPDREMGYYYPELSSVLDIPDREGMDLLDSLAREGVLGRGFVGKDIHCPDCKSLKLAPGYYCVKGGS